MMPKYARDMITAENNAEQLVIPLCCEDPTPGVIGMTTVRIENVMMVRKIVYCESCDSDLLTFWWSEYDAEHKEDENAPAPEN
jgi:hypothetical protein